MKKVVVLMIYVLLFCACNNTNDQEKIAQAEKDCAQKTKIDALHISFFGYFPDEADSINVKIKRGNQIIADFNEKIPLMIVDSLRHLREYTIQKEILLTDTVILKIKNETEKKAYHFKYMVRPHFTMSNCAYACEYYEVTVDNKVIEGGGVDFMKKGFEIPIRKNFKEYYKK
jgi:hypothetical protein